MKQLITAFILLGCTTTLFSQYYENNPEPELRTCFTVGILQGGGSLVGCDLEVLLNNRFGVQAGIGYIGFGAGFNIHVAPDIRSSFFSLQYWNQGVGDYFAQNAVGATYVFRGKKWFTFQGGLGIPLERGPALSSDFEQPAIMLMYAIGAYFPF